jgi:sugar phosphate isomerase/epimerase
MIRLSGFADEASDSLEGQIAATKELGWSYIEARSVDGINLHDLDEGAFESACEALEGAGLRINCLGSTIANWGKDVDEDFGPVMATVERAARRMKRLGIPMIRIMSYAIRFDESGAPAADQNAQKRITRLRAICERFAADGLVPVHENCLCYGGMDWRRSLELVEAIPSLRLVFDTGNPCLTPDFSMPRPWPNQDPLELWRHLKPYVVHVHVKDGARDPSTGTETYVYPGEGPCRVEEILADCIASGSDSWLSIVEYGRRLEAMLERIGLSVEAGQAARP